MYMYVVWVRASGRVGEERKKIGWTRRTFFNKLENGGVCVGGVF
jgi:hypothetical protein